MYRYKITELEGLKNEEKEYLTLALFSFAHSGALRVGSETKCNETESQYYFDS